MGRESDESSGPVLDDVHVLHLTGITPLVSSKAHKAWWRALQSARSLRHDGSRVVVTMDFNHRPALGSWEELWIMVEPQIETTDMLVFSIGDLIKIGHLLNVPGAYALAEQSHIPHGIAGARELDAMVQRAVKAVQRRLGNKTTIAVTCKRRELEVGTSGLPRQLRWFVVCQRATEKVISSFDTAILQDVREEVGGGDSWISGVIDSLVGSSDSAAAAPNWSEQQWRAAISRGDMLASLKQRTVGDFCNVTRQELDSSIAAHRAGVLKIVQ